MSLSETARDLARLRGEVGDVGGVRRDLVAGVASALAKGEYSVDFRDVADKLLRDVLGELLA